MRIILASQNRDKYKQLAKHFADFDVILIFPGKFIEVDEGKDSLLANANKKALAYSKINPSQLVFATDGGVYIPFLGDSWNHVMTKRLSGRDKSEKLTNRERAHILLDLMKDARGIFRKVIWCEAYSLVKDGQILHASEYTSNRAGLLLDYIPKNFKETGFWLGYLWYMKDFDKTYMELTEEEKKSVETCAHKLFRDLEEKEIIKK